MSTTQNRIIEMEIEKSFGNEATIDQCFDTLEKAMGQKGAPIGEIRTSGGKEYIKTPKGWRAKPKGFREKKNEESHETASHSTEGKVKNDLSSLSEWIVEPGSIQEKVYGKGAILPPKRNVVGESTPEHLAAQRLVRAGVLEPLGRKLNYAPAYKLTDKGKELFSQVNGTKNTPVFDGMFVNLDGSEFGLRNILDKTKGDRLLIRQTKINGSIKGIDEALIHSGWGYSTDKDENGKYEIGGPYILFYRKNSGMPVSFDKTSLQPIIMKGKLQGVKDPVRFPSVINGYETSAKKIFRQEIDALYVDIVKKITQILK